MSETKKVEPKGKPVVNSLLGLVKLDWIRPLMYKVGGRKMVMGGGGLAVIQQIVASEGEVTWPKAVACLAVAVVCGLGMFSVAHEDKKK